VAHVFREPRHPYTLGLLRSVPDFDTVRETLSSIPGAPPDLASPPHGCRFHPRCPFVQPDCLEGAIPLLELGSGRAVRCLHHDQVALDVRREPVIANG
jgi:oligopeptide/dipeptide ABC transporter ATP-binding protein